jgi:hypothetical protein
LIAILKKDIADNNKALAEVKVEEAKKAEAPKEAPDNPPAFTTTTQQTVRRLCFRLSLPTSVPQTLAAKPP